MINKPNGFAVASLVAILASTAACSAGDSGGGMTSAEETYARFEGMPADERRTALVEAAKEEGSLLIYAPSDVTAGPIADAFRKKYDIDIKVVNAGTQLKLRARVESEAQAGRIRADIIESQQGDMVAFDKKKYFYPYKSSARSTMPNAGGDGSWVLTSVSQRTVAWNPNLVKDPPKSLNDLTDPKYRGKLTIVNGSTPWYVASYEYFKKKGWSNAQFTKLMKGLVANAKFRDGNETSASLLSSGSLPLVLPTTTGSVPKFSRKGGAIQEKPHVPPVIVFRSGMGLTRNARNPAAALLFLEFYLSKSTNKILFDNYRVPANKITNPPDWLVTDKSILSPVPERIVGNASRWNAWQTAFTNLQQGSGEILPKSVR